MAIPTIVQTTGSATSAAAPATFAPTWTASTAGTCLVMVLGSATSATPTISTPANWVAGPISTNVSGYDVRVFYYPNNPGALTTATWNLTNINGIAGILYEVSNVNGVAAIDPNSTRSNTTTSTSAGTPAYATNPYNNVFMLGMIACGSGSTITDNSINGNVPWVQATQQTSTVGATNVRLYTASLLQGFNPINTAHIGGTLAPSVAWTALQVTFLSTSSAGMIFEGFAQSAAQGQGYSVGV